MTNARALTRSPLVNCKVKLPAASVCALNALTSSGIAISAPNFCRLVVGARHQCDTGNPRRKAEIIFDPSRGTSLTAKGAAIEHEDGEPFRRGIDRRGKTGGSGSHNGNVVDALRINGPNQTDTARKLMLAGIAQQLPAGAEHDRQLSGIDVEAFNQRLRLIIGLWIEQLMRMTVMTEKALQPEHIGAVGATDNDRTAGSGFKQPDAAEDQSTHDPLAKLSFGNQQRTQPLRCDDQGLDRLLRNRIR